jgi:hypothetical protein
MTTVRKRTIDKASITLSSKRAYITNRDVRALFDVLFAVLRANDV